MCQAPTGALILSRIPRPGPSYGQPSAGEEIEAHGIAYLAQWCAASKWSSWDLNSGLLVLRPLPSRENNQAKVGAWGRFTFFPAVFIVCL